MDHYAQKLRQRLLAGQGFDHQWQNQLAQLREELLPDRVLARLRDKRMLLIVPHHILHYFPFVALVTQPDRMPRNNLEMIQPRFLIDEPCTVAYAPSLAAWYLLRQPSARPITQIAAAGIRQLPGADLLPGITVELRALQQAFGRRVTTVLVEREADKPRVLALLEQPGMVLIGTHGRNWPDNPLASELLLYPQGSDNGRLTAAEIYGHEVQADLVVLSACYTALADKSPLPGDDLFGLQRALLQSGARTVIAGQWDIYDATGPELMENLFAHLSRGASSAESLANAQRQFLTRLRGSKEPEPWLHPYFWAMYTALGDDRTHVEPQ